MRTASSVGRPSRRKNEPGILPAAYARSSTSTVRGKKSTPGRTSWAALAVVSTVVVPMDATTAPWLCGAKLAGLEGRGCARSRRWDRSRGWDQPQGLLSSRRSPGREERPAGSQSAIPPTDPLGQATEGATGNRPRPLGFTRISRFPIGCAPCRQALRGARPWGGHPIGRATRAVGAVPFSGSGRLGTPAPATGRAVHDAGGAGAGATAGAQAEAWRRSRGSGRRRSSARSRACGGDARPASAARGGCGGPSGASAGGRSGG